MVFGLRSFLRRKPGRGLGKTLARDTRGAVAIEAGLIMPVYIYFTVFLFQLCLFFFWQEVLDNATATAARTIQVGSSQSQATTSATFVSNILCPALNGLMNCNQVIVNIAPVTSFYSTANFVVPRNKDGTINKTALTYCTGAPQSYMVVHALYNAPINLWPLASSTGGNTVIVSTAAFQNEPYPATGTPGC